ncbi:MAG: hypothetical protein ACLVD8_26405 [Enterocloster sp.]|uniref:P-type ATPase n=1 Tax=Enterocloster sp. TaxID=2719315 RepID=UPI00399B68BF
MWTGLAARQPRAKCWSLCPRSSRGCSSRPRRRHHPRGWSGAGGEVTVNQASLTGESIPVPKRPGGAVYAGTVVEEGECRAGGKAGLRPEPL